MFSSRVVNCGRFSLALSVSIFIFVCLSLKYLGNRRTNLRQQNASTKAVLAPSLVLVHCKVMEHYDDMCKATQPIVMSFG